MRHPIVKVQANEVIFDISPCIKHKVYLVLRFTKKEIERLKSSATQYNKALSGQPDAPSYGYAAPDLYSGLLTSEVVQHICLNRDLLSVTIPFIPDSLKVPLILLCCFVGLILFLKKHSTKGEETFEDQDDNPVYGIYASDGMDTTEATYTNEVYGGGGEEAERANQMHDVNPYYE